MDYIYTLAFLKRKNQVLMINREKNPWQGMWNGVGGKRFLNEDPLTCIIREIAEETGILVDASEVKDCGMVTWNQNFKAASSGLHLFLVVLPDDFNYDTPIPTPEGILDWKDIDWVKSSDNLGVAYNIQYFIEKMINEERRYHYACTFEGNLLATVDIKELI